MWSNSFNRVVDKHGQSFVIYKQGNTTRCPGFNSETGYCDPQYHRDNPTEPQCNEAGYVEEEPTQISDRAFIQPIGATSTSSRSNDLEKVLERVGEILVDDHLYIGKSDIDIFSLSKSDFLEHDGRNFDVLSPDSIEVGIEKVYSLALLRLRS
jgi:hypothetical protein